MNCVAAVVSEEVASGNIEDLQQRKLNNWYIFTSVPIAINKIVYWLDILDTVHTCITLINQHYTLRISYKTGISGHLITETEQWKAFVAVAQKLFRQRCFSMLNMDARGISLPAAAESHLNSYLCSTKLQRF